MGDELNGQQQQSEMFPQGATAQPTGQGGAEKYNTAFLTTNLLKERRRNQLILAGIVVTVVSGALLWLNLMPEPPKKSAKTAAQAQPMPSPVPSTAAVQPGVPTPTSPPADAKPGDAKK